MTTFLGHFVFPRESNRHRSFALHYRAIAVYIFFLLGFQIILGQTPRAPGLVLSYASNITVADLLADTNVDRQKNNVPALRLNDRLSLAAERKAENMFAEQYWAHTSPSGKDPWSFILGSGYTYLYAGENLARDFADSQGVVDAWMNSVSHRENLLNPRYSDVGFAVVNGKYGGYETTLVVQMLARPPGDIATVAAPPAAPVKAAVTVPKTVPAVIAGSAAEPVSPLPKVGINAFLATKSVSLILAGALILLLAVDAFVVWRRQIQRLAGHNLAHLTMMVALVVALVIIKQGAIL